MRRLPVKVLAELESELAGLPPSRARDIARELMGEIRRARRIPDRSTTIERFMARVSPCPVTGCWWWTGHHNRHGYGGFESGEVGETLAHRAGYALLVGPIPPGADLLHACDQPTCVNPSHLRPGGAAENADDMVRRGRQCNGENNPMAKMTAEQARQLIRDYAAGGSITMLEAKYGLSHANFYRILSGERWGHATETERAALSLRNERKAHRAGPRLDDEQVRELRKRHEAGESTWRLARRFGISTAYAYSVARRAKLKHVS